jgi:hypothetical protein
MKLPKLLKLSKTSWIFLSIGIFVVVIGSLGLARSKQLRDQAEMGDELNIAEMRVSNLQVKELNQRQEELQEKLDESIVQLEAAEESLRQPIASIDVTDEFFAIAYSCGVEVTNISSSSISSEDLEGIPCSKITINAMVTGKVSNLINFIIRLNNDFTTGIVNSAYMNIMSEESNKEPSMTVMMVIYTYKGD